ncbi:hypothetical protein [Pararobbsia alpina]|uniref:hypothetical protein n=1 Tax=Pararobbsia alpina TaxID=621374 RepID=UPI001C2EA418|nr:hypothetical protein [Pararobbsia alpina]
MAMIFVAFLFMVYSIVTAPSPAEQKALDAKAHMKAIKEQIVANNDPREIATPIDFDGKPCPYRHCPGGFVSQEAYDHATTINNAAKDAYERSEEEKADRMAQAEQEAIRIVQQENAEAQGERVSAQGGTTDKPSGMALAVQQSQAVTNEVTASINAHH